MKLLGKRSRISISIKSRLKVSLKSKCTAKRKKGPEEECKFERNGVGPMDLNYEEWSDTGARWAFPVIKEVYDPYNSLIRKATDRLRRHSATNDGGEVCKVLAAYDWAVSIN